jgi:hypothetical protein
MSFPSVGRVAEEFGFDLNALSSEEGAAVLLESVKRDCPEAMAFLRAKVREADESGGSLMWTENPNSLLGKQLIRIHASDAVRPLVEKYVCDGKPLAFLNCCGGVVGPKPPKQELVRLQIQMQAGPIAHADC